MKRKIDLLIKYLVIVSKHKSELSFFFYYSMENVVFMSKFKNALYMFQCLKICSRIKGKKLWNLLINTFIQFKRLKTNIIEK